MTNTENGACTCSSRDCTFCAPAARAAAVAVEQAANTPTAEPDKATTETPTARVELSVFGRAVTVEAPESLAAVAAIAERLWQKLDPVAMPLGASGFVMSEPDGSGPPAEMGERVVGPYRDWEVRSAA